MSSNIANFINIKPNSVTTSFVAANNANLYNANISNLTCTNYAEFKGDVTLGTSQNIVNNVVVENARVRNNFGVYPEITQPYGSVFNLPILGTVHLFNDGGVLAGTVCNLSDGANVGQIKSFIVASTFDSGNLPITINGNFYSEDTDFTALELGGTGVSIELIWDGSYWIPKFSSSSTLITFS